MAFWSCCCCCCCCLFSSLSAPNERERGKKFGKQKLALKIGEKRRRSIFSRSISEGRAKNSSHTFRQEMKKKAGQFGLKNKRGFKIPSSFVASCVRRMKLPFFLSQEMSLSLLFCSLSHLSCNYH